MKIKQDKSQDDKDKSVANVSGQHNKASKSSIVDNRPEGLVQRKLRALAATSGDAHKILQLHALSRKHHTSAYPKPADSSVEPHHKKASQLRSKKPDDIHEKRHLIQVLSSNVKTQISGSLQLDGPQALASLWEEGMRVYLESVNQGKILWRELMNAIKNYQDDVVPSAPAPGPAEQTSGVPVLDNTEGSKPLRSPKQELIAKNQDKRTEFDRRFEQSYYNEAQKVNGSTGKYKTFTSSDLTPINDKRRYDYQNTINFESGTIEADSNFAYEVDDYDWTPTKSDKALIENQGLPGSEILWQQAKLAAKRHLPGGTNTEIEDELKKISTISRRSVINHETIVVLTMAYPDGKFWPEVESFKPGDDDFFAVLGTPNARSSARFLIDHMDQLEKTIDRIDANGYLDIKFKPIA